MIEANNDEVICPNCVTQFRAIPVNVQELLRAQDALLRKVNDFLARVTHWQEGKPDLHDMKVAIREALK